MAHSHLNMVVSVACGVNRSGGNITAECPGRCLACEAMRNKPPTAQTQRGKLLLNTWALTINLIRT